MDDNKNAKTGSSGAFVPRVRRGRKRNKGGIGPDGKPVAPIIITAVIIIMLLVAVYFGTVEGWFKAADPSTVDATIPPEVTPQPTVSAAIPFSALDEKALNVIALDVGQGQCTFIVSPNGKTMLIDSGDAEHAEFVCSALNELGIERIDAAFATSASDESMGGMAAIVAGFRVGRLYLSPSAARSNGYPALVKAAQDSGAEVILAQTGSNELTRWDKSCTVTMFVPDYEDKNTDVLAGCMALRLAHNGYSFFIAGQLAGRGEAAVIETSTAGALKSTVLFVAACGADTATGDALIAAASPSYAVISVGSGNKSGCPADSTLAKLNAKGIKIYRTDRNGTVRIVVDKNGLRFD